MTLPYYMLNMYNSYVLTRRFHNYTQIYIQFPQISKINGLIFSCQNVLPTRVKNIDQGFHIFDITHTCALISRFIIFRTYTHKNILKSSNVYVKERADKVTNISNEIRKYTI